ncbi:MAG: discoidin domain-containing protein, partial [Nitrososphaera sp.]
MQKDNMRRIAVLSAAGIVLSLFTIMPTAYNQASAAVCENLSVKGVTSNGDDGTNKAANTLDNNLSTRWSKQGKGSWITADLGEKKTICSVDIAWYKGYSRTYSFTISISSDGTSFTQVYSGKSSSDTLDPEKYDFADVEGRYVRITVNGNNNNSWAGITEIDIFGDSSSSSPPPSSMTINFANVAEGQTLSGSYKVVVSASDTSLVSNIKLYVDGVLFKTENYSPYEYTIDTTGYADGNYV